MSAQSNLPQELIRAARSLEERFQILGLPAYKIPPAQWDALPGEIRAVIPAWVPALLSNYSLVDAGLQFEPLEGTSANGTFWFFRPDSYAVDLVPRGEYRELIDFGFFPFGYEEASGSVWVATIADGPAGNIYLVEHTAHGPGKPTPDNGLHYAHRNLACFLSAMAVSNANPGKGFWGR
jgi:hypothetical protein